jgi:hypothetical protein
MATPINRGQRVLSKQTARANMQAAAGSGITSYRIYIYYYTFSFSFGNLDFFSMHH